MGAYDADLALFAQYVKDAQAVPYYAKWESANKNGDAPKWRSFRDKLLAGQSVAVPSMATAYGKSLVGAGQQHMSISHLVGAVQNPYPPPDPPPVTPPPPPTSTSSGLGYFKLGAGELPTAHINDFSFVILSGGWGGSNMTLPAGRCLAYMNGLKVEVQAQAGYHNGVPYEQASPNGWTLKNSGGTELRMGNYPASFCGDVGSAAYQNRFCTNVLALMQQWGADGFYVDDTNINIGYMNGTPALYPDNASRKAAELSFIQAVGTFFRPRGIYVAFNASAYLDGSLNDNNGVNDLAWIQQIAPYADGIMIEYFQWHDSIAANRGGDGRRYFGTSAWWQFWQGWQPIATYLAQQGKDLIALNYSSDVNQRNYAHASFLIDFNGSNGAFFGHAGTTLNPWNTTYDVVKNLGAPIGSKVQNGNRWERTFTNGFVWVDPTTGASSIT